ncbi:MAG: hypothetical protein KGV50_05280 [Gammaproteobacteria bacterium]|nr:hypothetical protein [Gammaproteobacteria bacterium]
MRHAIILLIIAALLTVGGTYLSQNEGSVAITLANGTYEMPLWYFLVALVTAIVTVMIVVKVVWTVIRLPKILGGFGKNRRKITANNLLQKGMLAMGKGQWRKAENMLVKGSRLMHKANGDPSLFLSTAAQAAQQQGADARRDQYLLEARQLSVEGVDTLTSSLAEARLHLEAGESNQALESIKTQRTLNGQNPQILAVQSQAYEQLGKYREVWDLLSDLKKQFPDKEGYKIRQMEIANIIFTSDNSSIDDIERVWSELPKAAKLDDNVFLAYISGLITHGQEERAEQLLSKSIRKDTSDMVIHAYTQLECGSSTERLGKIKRWLKSNPQNAYLNYGAAKFAYQSELFDDAKDYALASLESQTIPETFALLGKIYEALGEGTNAMQAYKGSLALIYTSQPQAIAGDVLLSTDTLGLPEAESNISEAK